MFDSIIFMCILTLLVIISLRYIVLNSFSFLTGDVLSDEMRLLLCTLSNLEIFTLFFTEPLVLLITFINLFRVSNHYQLSSEIVRNTFEIIFYTRALIGNYKFSDLPLLRYNTGDCVISECKKGEYDGYRNGTLYTFIRIYLPDYYG